MEFCDNKRQLFQAYFRDFTIERLDFPWQAFTGGWHLEVAARKLGINSSFIKGDYCYVLVRVSRFRETGKLSKDIPANQVLFDEVSSRIRNVTPGDTTSTVQFMNSIGTHYINSYVTGNSLYQVGLIRTFCAAFSIRYQFAFVGICVQQTELQTHQRKTKDSGCGCFVTP